jgi:signal transduction histidine kinase
MGEAVKTERFLRPGFQSRVQSRKRNPKLRCSQEWLREVFDILAENAVDATDGLPLRRLMIKTRIENEQIEIAFIDNGEGIHKNILKSLFKERIKKRRTKGLGIGLLMTQAIVQAYDGDIKVLRAGPGNTTMVIYLPEQQRKARQ